MNSTMGHQIRTDLKLLQCNVRSLYTSRIELRQLIEELSPDIITLNETNLTPLHNDRLHSDPL